MPKSQFLSPEQVLSAGEIVFPTISVNRYAGEGETEYAREDYLEIYRQMVAIRAFETRLDELKKYGKTQNVTFSYVGPLHLCVGQEATAVGANYLYDKNDFILGTHRNHGEVLAKGLSAMRKMSDDELVEMMRTYHNAQTLIGAQKIAGYGEANAQKRARLYFYYGLFAEIFGKTAGFQRGLSGSMHLFFTPLGIYPNNAIVGGSAGIAAGLALSKKLLKKLGVVSANLGDAALGCGAVWEAMNFSAMDQYHTLWKNNPGGLPIVFTFFNNQYGMGGQTVGETMAYGALARAGAGVNPEAMHAERVNGYDPFAVIDAYRRKLPLLKEGKGPVLMDLVTYRYSEHSASDSGSYRTEEEVAAWKAADPLTAFAQKITERGVATQTELDTLRQETEGEVLSALALAASEETPYATLAEEKALLKDVLYEKDGDGRGNSAQNIAIEASLQPAKPLKPIEDNSRGKTLSQKRADGTYTLSDGIFEAVLSAFYRTPSLVAYGEENRDWGNVSGVYVGLTEALPYERLFNAPISESAIVSTAVGYAMGGGRALIEIMFMDFMGRAFDELLNQLAKWRSLSGGEFNLPVVVRTAIGKNYGAQHSQDFSAMLCHVPGLKVVYPATPYDAKGLMATALTQNAPIVFIESQKLYNQTATIPIPENDYFIPLGKANLLQDGEDVTILSVGATLPRVLSAAAMLKKEGVSAQIVDARSLVPFDYDTLLAAVRKTGRILLVSDECERGAYVKEIAATVVQQAFSDLKAPPAFACSENTLIPLAAESNAFYPSAEDIAKKARNLVKGME